MNLDKYYIKNLEEKIYYGINKNSEAINFEIIKSFFQELIKRKRNDPFEGGLQASMILFSTSFAGKVCL
ncbi:MAG: hypothetical protein IKN63_05705 [Bacilli bacterium]|nr:hypothetical protein [Bacilli bacterium]